MVHATTGIVKHVEQTAQHVLLSWRPPSREVWRMPTNATTGSDREQRERAQREAVERMNREAPPGLRYHYAPTMREAENMALRIAREAGLPVTRGTGDTRREPIARLITYPVCVDITLYPNGEHVEDGSVLHRIFYGYWMP